MEKKRKDKGKWYNRIWFTRNLCWLYLALVSCWDDIRNFLLFRREMKALSSDPNSMFRQMDLSLNKLGNVVYTHKIMDRDRVLTFSQPLKNAWLIDVTQNEHRYLFDELNWGEYLITRFVEFSDEDGNKSGYYGVTFTFEPMTVNNPKVYRLLLFYLAVFGLAVWTCRHWIATAAIWLLQLLP